MSNDDRTLAQQLGVTPEPSRGYPAGDWCPLDECWKQAADARIAELEALLRDIAHARRQPSRVAYDELGQRGVYPWEQDFDWSRIDAALGTENPSTHDEV